MIPWAAILSLAGTAASGVMSAINNKRSQQESDARAAADKAHYEAEAAQNPLSTSASRAAIGQYDRDAQKQVETARGVAAIKGATPEYSLGVQKGVAEGRANLLSNIAAGASAREDRMKEKAQEVVRNKYAEDQARHEARNQTYANLLANSASSLSSLLNGFGGEDTQATEENASDASKAALDLIYGRSSQNNKSKQESGLGVHPK